MDLQSAQDRLETIGIMYSTGKDVTGEGRSQVIDSV